MRDISRRVLVGAILVCAPESLWAQELIVTATGFPQNQDETGQAVTVIDAEAIDRRQSQSLADLLVTTPSISLSSNGSLGSVTSLSLRGAEAGQTLVLIDGVRINDPSGTTGAVDFGNLLTANVRRIEVMRGSNAIAYGSDAMGGVVDISTRDESAADGLSLRTRAEAGYANTFSGSVDLGWRDGESRLDLGLAGLRTDGISSAARRFGATEPDGLANLTGHIRLDVPLSDGISLDVRGYAVDARLDYDSFFGMPADSADESHFRQFTGYAALVATSFDGRLQSRVSLTWLANRRDYRFAPDTPPDFGYRGQRWRAEYQGSFEFDPVLRIAAGLAHDAPQYRFFGFGSDETHSSDTDSAYGMAIVKPAPRLTVTGGVRYDHHSQFGGVATLGANANWGLADGLTRFRLAYGEGFRAPSLYQLYDGYSGNAALEPERSRSLDVGVDRTVFEGRGRLAFTVFTRTTRNQIDFDMATFRYANLGRTLARGIELSAELEPVKSYMITVSYSLVDTRDRTLSSSSYNEHLQRRPSNSFILSLDKAWTNGSMLGGTVRLVGNSRDQQAPTGTLDGYAVADMRAAVALVENVLLQARIENIFDTQYETAYGYGTFGRSFYAGVRAQW